MQMEPGFNFSKEYPKLDKALKIIGPFLAAIIVFIAMYGLQMIVFALTRINVLFFYMFEAIGVTVDPVHFNLIIPGILAIWAYFRPHGSQAAYNTRLQSTNKNANIPFYDDPHHPTPQFRMNEEEESPPEVRDA